MITVGEIGIMLECKIYQSFTHQGTTSLSKARSKTYYSVLI
jgi:hypothetical protein